MRDLIIDCFAGGGGASVGIEMALGRQVDIAINHDDQAIRMHKTNHPVEHNSRLRKYYRITEGGKEHIQEFLNDWQQVTDIYDFVKGAVENEEG